MLTALLTSGRSTEYTTGHSRLVRSFGVLTSGRSRIIFPGIEFQDSDCRDRVLVCRRRGNDVALLRQFTDGSANHAVGPTEVAHYIFVICLHATAARARVAS